MNVLLTSVGRRNYMVQYFKQIIGNDGKVVATNSSQYAAGMAGADAAFVSPLIYQDEYIPFLLELCRKESITLLVSLFDIDLPILSAHKKEFENLGVTVAVSDETVLDICNDKWQMCRFLREQQLPVPETFLDMTAETGWKALLSGGKSLLIKPRWGMGSLDIYEADTEEEARVFYSKAARNLEKSYLRFEAEKDPSHAILIQEKLEGAEYGMDVINDLNGQYQTTIVRRKIAMRSGETDIAEIVDAPQLQQLGEQISRALGHVGCLDMDVIVNDKGNYIIDMNARFGGGYPFSHIAGADIPKALLCWCRGEKAPSECFEVRIGTIGFKDIRLLAV